jgi:F-type H+-transporting ATPase subunit delta
LLKLLLRHYRLHQLDEIYRQFRREMNERRGVVPVEVTTAAPIGPEHREKFQRELRQMTGKQVELQFKTDGSLVGGAVTKIGSVIYDGSIRAQLAAIRQKLAAGES